MSPQCKNSLQLYAGNDKSKIEKLLKYQDESVKEEMCKELGCTSSTLAETLQNTINVW